ncbi:MAG: type II secretion system F family protein [Acidobacteriota bacterium]
MPDFECRLGTPGGDVIVQHMSASSEAALKKQLEEKGYYIFAIKPKSAISELFKGSIAGGKKVPLRDFILFNQELSALLKAGLPVLSALDLLLARKHDPGFQQHLELVRDDVSAGASLSEAFANRGRAFPPIYPATIAAGEKSGELVSVIQRYLFYLRTVQAIRKKVASAVIYPIILLVMSVVLITLLLTVIVPKFAGIFKSAGASLPLITRIVMAVSEGFQYGWPFILAGLLGIVAALKIMSLRPGGKLLLSQARMKIPGLGPNILRYNVSQMSRTLGTLISGGIPVVTALEVVAEAMSNEIYRRGLKRVRQRILEGQSLWSSLEEEKIAPALALEMIEVGESTGALDEMLDQVSRFYDEELTTAVERFVALLEPALLVVMAVLIAIIVLSVYMPLFSMYSIVGQ